ncbi:MAG TPA: hypothetical protein DDY13_01445 [Cytophagales bacterium]|nr:hypothetical protein [Cytophagales bacterium]
MEMINWVVEDSSDVLCIQEFCTANRWEPLAVELQILNSGRNLAFQDIELPHGKYKMGMAIATKFDIPHSELYP